MFSRRFERLLPESRPLLPTLFSRALRQPFSVTGNTLTVKPHGSETVKDKVAVSDVNYSWLLFHSFREVGIKDSIFLTQYHGRAP